MDELKAKLQELGYANPPIEDVLSYAVFPEVAVNFFKANGRM